MSGPTPTEPSPPARGKAARNERRKLLATWLNGVSIASFLAAIVQPLLNVVQEQRALLFAEGALSLMLLLVSAGAHIAAHVIAERLED